MPTLLLYSDLDFSSIQMSIWQYIYTQKKEKEKQK